MSLKPIDFQISFPRTTEVSRIYSDEQQKNQAIYQQQSQTVQQKADDSMRQVHKQENAYKIEMKEKQERDQKNRREGNKKKKAGYVRDDRKNNGYTSIDIRL